MFRFVLRFRRPTFLGLGFCADQGRRERRGLYRTQRQVLVINKRRRTPWRRRTRNKRRALATNGCSKRRNQGGGGERGAEGGSERRATAGSKRARVEGGDNGGGGDQGERGGVRSTAGSSPSAGLRPSRGGDGCSRSHRQTGAPRQEGVQQHQRRQQRPASGGESQMMIASLQHKQLRASASAGSAKQVVHRDALHRTRGMRLRRGLDGRGGAAT